MKISITPGVPVKLAWLACPAPTVTTADLLQQCALQMAEQFVGKMLSEDPVVQQVRQLFRAVGIDPTKYRPSSEALLRRALKGEPVRSINATVDINNICSMEYRLPFGCYDAERIQGDVIVRLGEDHEEYTGVAKQISIGGKLCCADTAGPFGSPISDSARTKVTDETKKVLVLAFAHTSTSDAQFIAALDRFISLSFGASTLADSHLHRGLATAPHA